LQDPQPRRNQDFSISKSKTTEPGRGDPG
jgi:hypothetical protein